MNTATDEQLRSEGISDAHARSFLEVAKQQGCVILTRTPGKACLIPLAEGYDAKGFHIKGKSCDWGPMAGFLCAEPLFNKKGGEGAASNAHCHNLSLTQAFDQKYRWDEKLKKEVPIADTGVRSGLVALEISERRRAWLIDNKYITLKKSSQDRCAGETPVPNAGATLQWMMQRDPKTARWTVYFEPKSVEAAMAKVKTDLKQPQELAEWTEYNKLVASMSAANATGEYAGYRPVMALTNPYPPFAAPLTYLNAVTGDFDLFAVWPRKGKEADFRVRIGGMQQGTTAGDIDRAEKASSIGRVVGNISNGVYLIDQLLNAVMVAQTRQDKVNRVFHSDEGGRPGIGAIDGSVAFVPPAAPDTTGKVHYFPDKSPEFPAFVLGCARAGFTIFLNNGWIDPLKQALTSAEWKELEKSVEWQTALC